MPMVLLVAALEPYAAATPPTALDPSNPGVPRTHGATPALPVTGGDPVEDALDWPDTAGIVIQGGVECTGTLIAPDVVLTAGHCLEHTPSAVILGTNDYRHPGEQINVDEAYEYPNSWGNYDVAVLILEHPSAYEPRRIATSCIRDDIRDGAEVIIVGYGAMDGYGYDYSPVLQWGTTTISDADCSQLEEGCFANVSPGGELAAGVTGADSCFGDSGGPLYLPTSKGTFLAGVTSRGAPPCGSGSIFVRPDAPELHDWIERVTGRTLPAPGCFEPTAPALYAVKNHPGHSQIDARYPEGEPFTYEIATRPINGGATVDDDGLVTFTPETGFKGEDEVTVAAIASDGGVAEIVIPIKMVNRSTYRQQTGEGVPGACSTGGFDLGGFALLVALAAARRRR